MSAILTIYSRRVIIYSGRLSMSRIRRDKAEALCGDRTGEQEYGCFREKAWQAPGGKPESGNRSSGCYGDGQAEEFGVSLQPTAQEEAEARPQAEDSRTVSAHHGLAPIKNPTKGGPGRIALRAF